MKILAVEDNTVARAVLLKFLHRLGHEIIEAYDGDTAWDLLQKNADVRVIVSDWNLPGSDGLSLCRKIRDRAGGDYAYFILVTGTDASEKNRERATDAGVDDFLTKPLNFNELWTRLRVAERILRYTTHVRQLEGLLPICIHCKKIRDEKNDWRQVEGYVRERTGADFSHCVCPDCRSRVVVPELEQAKASAAKKSLPAV